jgi:hypothetical protein
MQARASGIASNAPVTSGLFHQRFSNGTLPMTPSDQKVEEPIVTAQAGAPINDAVPP